MLKQTLARLNDRIKRHFQAQPPVGAMPKPALLPVIVTVLLIAAVWAWHVQYLPQGAVRHFDEFHTFDRSIGFARFDDWSTVYNNNKPGFRKPPLQYWMIGGLIEAGVDQTVALRLPSMLFMLGSLVLCAWLALVLVPGLPWAMPAAVLLCASSVELWAHAVSAMLDVGATFFLTLTLITMLKAFLNPRWWYAVALSITLGALQKAPVGLVMLWLGLWLYNRTAAYHGGTTARFKETPQYKRAIWLSIAGVLVWPLFQSLLHGGIALQDLYGRQMVERFAPVGPVVKQRTGSDLYDLLIASEPLLRSLMIMALAWLPFRLRRPDLLFLPGLFAIFALTMLLANGSVYARYTLLFVPLLAAALGVVLVTLPPVRWQALGLGLAMAVSLGAGGPFRPAKDLALYPSDLTLAKIAALTKMAPGLQDDETLVVCNFTRESRFPDGMISVYGAVNDKPFVGLKTPGRVDGYRDRLAGKLRGVCHKDDLPLLAPRLVDLQQVGQEGAFLFWTGRLAD